MKSLFPFFWVSVLLHVAVLAGFSWIFLPESSSVLGVSDGDPEKVYVTVISEQDMEAVAPAPAPVDAPEAKESKPEPPEQAPDVEEPPQQERETDEMLVAREEQPVEKKEEKSIESVQSIASDIKKRKTALGRDIQEFQARLLAAIRQATFFPQQALRENRHGEVTVSFVLNRDGTLSSIQVTNSSGTEILDEAAREILRRAAKTFPPFPPSVLDETLAYTVPIHFRERHSARAERSSMPK